MKWFFDLFKNNEEEDEEIDLEHNFQNVTSKKMESNKGREMETRISYQYPKGEFRFPLIPDDDEKEKNILHGEKEIEIRKSMSHFILPK